MKRFALALAAVAVGGFAVASDADAQSRWRRGGGTTVIEQAPAGGLDANTLALLAATGALGAGSGGASALLPFLLTQPQTQTIVTERGGRRWRRRD